ncbi:hypothetical protein VKT23_002553 [Stygiomarasmius scandens]|uniref:Uncharacterized protein n=1 Tax=Marasmiellus scandens TaxID=2682957 RepID=A0ABR1K488_9AGAR
MLYSCAVWKDFQFNSPEESLEDAQLRKLKSVLQWALLYLVNLPLDSILLKRLNIQPGHRLLEIGTGWGAFAILAARSVECSIDTVTLSASQAEYSRKRIKEAGLSDRINVHHMDYRECLLKPEWQRNFDRFFSLEMMEHVGKDFMSEYWAIVDWALRPQDAVGVVQVITMPEARVPAYDRSGADFVQKWVSLAVSFQQHN